MGNVDVASLNPENALNAALPTRTGEHAAVDRLRQGRLAAKIEAEGAHTFLEGLKSGVSESDTRATIDRNFGARYDAAGTLIPFTDANEARYFGLANEAASRNRLSGDELLYAGATAAEKTQILNRLESAFNRVPQLRSTLAAMGAGKTNFLETVVQDPSFAHIVRKLHGERITKGDVNDHDVNALDTEYADKDQALQERQKKVDEINAEQQILAELVSAASTHGVDLAGLPTRVRESRLSALQTDATRFASRPATALAAREVDVFREYRDTKAELDKRIALATGTPLEATLRAQLTSLETATPLALKTEAGLTQPGQGDQLARLDTLARSEYANRKAKLDVDNTQAVRDREAAKAERSTVDGKRSIARHKKMVEEARFADQLENVLGDAAIDYLDNELAGSEKVRQAEIAKLVGAEKDANKARILAMLGNRWNKSGKSGILGRNITKLHKNHVAADYKELMANGPEAMIRQVMNSDSELKKLQTTNPEQYRELFNDKDTQKEFMATLLQKRFESGTMPSHEVRRLLGTSWGNEAIDAAISKNKSAEEKIKSLRETNNISGSISEWLSKRGDLSLMALIAAILGGMWTGATYAGALAAGASGMAFTAGSAEALAAGGAVVGGTGAGLLGTAA